MTLLIAILLIYQFSLPSWMYAVAVVIWLAKNAWAFWMNAALSQEITSRFRR